MSRLGSEIIEHGYREVQNPHLPSRIVVKVAGWSLPKARLNGPPFVTKTQLVNVLEQVGVLLELTGANGFRVRAYQNGSRTLASMEEDLFSVVSENRITEVNGIGNGNEWG